MHPVHLRLKSSFSRNAFPKLKGATGLALSHFKEPTPTGRTTETPPFAPKSPLTLQAIPGSYEVCGASSTAGLSLCDINPAYEKMKSLGIKSVKVQIADGQGHGFFNQQPWADITLIAADKFLNQLGLIEGEPTLPAPANGEKLVERPINLPSESNRNN